MKHSQYKHWILDESELGPEEKRLLKDHLSVCKECRQLKVGWDASRKMLLNPVQASPAPGFAIRWQETLARKTRIEKVRRYRLTIAGFVLTGFAASLVYMIASGTFMQMLADSFNIISRLVFGITNGLSTIGFWIRRVPLAVPIAAGFILFGLLTAFLMATAFMLWNVNNNNKKKLAHEIIAD